MGIFSKRPLAFFSFIFLIFSLFAFYIPTKAKLVVSIAALFICIILFVLSFIIKKSKIHILISCICVSAIILSMAHSFVFIGLPTQKAKSHVGRNKVLCYVIDEEYVSDSVKEYSVKIKKVGDDNTNIRALLVCDFKREFNEGDEIYGIAEIVDSSKTNSDKSDLLLTVYMDDSEHSYVKQTSRGIFETLFSECGIEILSGKLSDSIQSKLYDAFGSKKGALALGFFTGERSDMPAEITRDFRRAGVSHLMAVSGSHIAILLGGIEIILRKLSVHKNIRCITVALFGIAFLFVTGFSLSACRSVFMLYAVYLGYFLSEDSDPITSLFVSVLVIVLIFPYSIVDVGLIMSFLATLGLLTVYPILEEKLPYPRKKKKHLKRLLLIGRELLLIALMTIVANMFLLPIIWYFFGEFSLISVICNILISFISSAFLLSVPLFLFFGKIPIIGFLLKLIVSFLADIILFAVTICSRAPFATISLKYDFCHIIVALFTVFMCVFLIVKLKHKLWVVVPYGAAVLGFIICFTVYSAFYSKPSVTYTNYGENEYFIVNDNMELSICDNTSGGMPTYYNISEDIENSTATEIGKYVLTHYHKGHITSLDLLSQKKIIRRLYLPMPISDDDKICSEALWSMAREKGIGVEYYQNGDSMDIIDDVTMNILTSNEHDIGQYMSFYGKEKSVVYMTPAYYSRDNKCDILIIGEHGVKSDGTYDIDGLQANKTFISSDKIQKYLRFTTTENIYVSKNSDSFYKITFMLE